MRRHIMGYSSWNNLEKSFESAMYKVVDHILYIYGHFFQDFPSSFYGHYPLLRWDRLDTFFVFQALTVDFHCGQKEVSNWLLCVSTQAVASCMLVLEESCDQLHCQFPTQKEKLVFVGFWCFVVVQFWQCCSVYYSNIGRCMKVIDFGLTVYLPIF